MTKLLRFPEVREEAGEPGTVYLVVRPEHSLDKDLVWVAVLSSGPYCAAHAGSSFLMSNLYLLAMTERVLP